MFVAAPIVTCLKEREPRHREVRARLIARGLASSDTLIINSREVGGPALPARAAARTVARPTGIVSTDTLERTAASGGTATDTAPRPAPTGAIPPRPRKKKRR